MKTLLCILLTACLMLGLCACASQEKITVPKEQPTETTAAPVETTAAPEEPSADSEETAPSSEEPTTEEPASTDAADSVLAEQLIGTWDWEFDVSELMVSQLSESLGMDISDRGSELELKFCLTFEFAEDGTCKAYFDEEKLTASFDGFIDGLCVVLTDVTYDLLDQQGVSKEDADANFETQYGCDINTYYDELLRGSLNLETMFGQLPKIDSTYKLEGDQLTIAQDGEYHDDAVTISIDGDTLTIDGFVDASFEETFGSLGMSLPFVMTRK